ncbi:transporter [Vibrio coralliilyticus]|uniref:Transporter n=1 Tax=Vibrio coralliilyticus TaxID=190893 RepID=A0A837G9W7_9VIBR|nr:MULTISPECIES: YeeE/YedE family protein [Vibrio]EEX32013.1 predicted transporter component [Vibrio coralliilyticus ATCC BAA-450]KJY76572.1 transporter [Vibrio coralliilyticus]MDE3896806.1 YeeE/YedE family protein [Vibrio sp. CC007]QOU33035.1 YeeE/YedE family protein [Vibrio coralliilyticus]
MGNATLRISALVSGLLFGIGMALSGMTNPENVIGFLDVTGAWNPSLVFVMGGALLIFAPAYHFLIKPQAKALSGDVLSLPTKVQLDSKLIYGAALFGVGWGLAGICPGPAITSLAFGNLDIAIFIASMVSGSLLAKYVAAPSPQMVSQN